MTPAKRRSVCRRHRVDCRQLGSHELGCEVVMLHAPSQDSNLKTDGMTLAASLSNIFNVLRFGSLSQPSAKYLRGGDDSLCAKRALPRRGLRTNHPDDDGPPLANVQL
jgi:hypothetical protein